MQQAAHEDECQALLVKLAEDRFNLAVLGQFKRGKLADERRDRTRSLAHGHVAADVGDHRAVLWPPGTGGAQAAGMEHAGARVAQPAPAPRDRIRQSGQPERDYRGARREPPSPFLRRGLYFVDTPGVGSAQQGNTATTYDFLPQADAVVFVTSVEAPLSHAEESFLRDIRQYVRRLFVVVNKLDLVDDQEREGVLAYIRAGIRAVLGTNGARLYPLSARQGLQAKLHNDREALQQSGLPAFEADLTAFVTEEKSEFFLVAILGPAAQAAARGRGNGWPDVRLQELRALGEALRAALSGRSMVAVAQEEVSLRRMRACSMRPSESSARRRGQSARGAHDGHLPDLRRASRGRFRVFRALAGVP